MRFARGMLGALLWIVASVVGLLAVVLCATVILLPVGIPLLMVARRMFGRSMGLLLPRGLTHPVDEGGKKVRKGRKDAAEKVGKVTGKVTKAGRKKAAELRPGRRKRRLVPW